MSGRVALITGCGKKMGIGAVAARALAASGMTVVVASVARRADYSIEAGAEPWWLPDLVAQIVAAGGVASSLQGDVSVERDAAAMVGEVLKRYGRLDILINNAGAPQGLDRNNIEAVPVSAWDENMAINARGVFLMCRAAVTPMRAQHWGRIINVSSAAAKTGRKNMAVYAASKAAVLGFTRALGVEVAPYGITVNAICPYSVLTDRALSSAKRVAGGGDVDAALAEKARGIPVGRHGRPEDVAGMIQYLASDVSAFVTGQAISVCGGVT